MTDFLVVGQLGKPHGVWGEVRLQILTDFPERLKRGVLVYLGEDHRPERIRGIRSQDDFALIAFEGYGDRETAEVLRNEMVYVRAGDRPPLEEGAYYQHQLLGLQVYTAEPLPDTPVFGTVMEILETGANDVLVIKTEAGQEVLLPILEATILRVDLAAGFMVVYLLPGLI